MTNITEIPQHEDEITEESIADVEAAADAILKQLATQDAARQQITNPARLMKERARKLRRATMLPEKPSLDDMQVLSDQMRILDAMFRNITLDGGDTLMDEKAGITLALRTQHNWRVSFQTAEIARQFYRARTQMRRAEY